MANNKKILGSFSKTIENLTSILLLKELKLIDL